MQDTKSDVKMNRKSDLDIDKTILMNIEIIKNKYPEKYKIAQGVGERLMNIDYHNFNTRRDKVAENISVKDLLKSISYNGLTINDLTTSDINVLKQYYGHNWKEQLEYYLSSLSGDTTK